MKHLPKDDRLVRIYRYEDIIFAKRDFLADVYEFVGLDVDNDVIAKAADAVDVFPDEERVSQRARIVKPGNYREKLSEAGIARVEAAAREYLAANGYL